MTFQRGQTGVHANNLKMGPGLNQELETALIQLLHLAEWIVVDHLKISLPRIVAQVRLFKLASNFASNMTIKSLLTGGVFINWKIYWQIIVLDLLKIWSNVRQNSWVSLHHLNFLILKPETLVMFIESDSSQNV